MGSFEAEGEGPLASGLVWMGGDENQIVTVSATTHLTLMHQCEGIQCSGPTLSPLTNEKSGEKGKAWDVEVNDTSSSLFC